MKPKNNDIEASILISSKNKFAIPKIINNFKYTKCNYEILIVGPFKNQNSTNLKVINSYNKPPQCHTIAFKEAKGKYVSFFSDDVFFEDRKAFDKILKLTKKNKKKLVSWRLSNKINRDLNSFRLHPEIKDSPLLPHSPLIKKKILNKLKLFDNRFVATLYDIDLYLRMIKNGYKILYSELFLKEKHYNNYSLNQDYNSIDRKLLNNLWLTEDKVGKKTIYGDKIYLKMRNSRLDKLHFYNFKNLKKPQGKFGRWRFNNSLYFFLANKLYFTIFKKILRLPLVKSKLYLFYRIYIKTKLQK